MNEKNQRFFNRQYLGIKHTVVASIRLRSQQKLKI